MANAKRLVLLSIDGFQPSHYLDPAGPFRKLRELGAHVPGLEPVYPTVTSTNHVSLATGVTSDLHGVATNTHFDPEGVTSWEGGESRDWIFDESRIRVPTLWQRAVLAGKRVALLRWPVTRGARVDWLVPDVFESRARSPEQDWALTRSGSTPKLIGWLESRPGFRVPLTHAELDERTVEAATHLLRAQAADLLLVHLNSYDHAVHETGMRSAGAARALGRLERMTARLLADIDWRDTRVLVVGDHGFMDFDRRFHVNALLASEGWLRAENGRIQEWQAVAHSNCGQAFVHLRRPGRERELVELLRTRQNLGFQVLDPAELARLRCPPGPCCAVEALPGFSIGQKLEGPPVEKLARSQGEHGYLATYPSLQAGMIALGQGFEAGQRLALDHLTEVTAFAAALLGITWDDSVAPGRSTSDRLRQQAS